MKVSFLPHILWKFIERILSDFIALAFLGSSSLAVDDIDEIVLLKIDSFTFGIPLL